MKRLSVVIGLMVFGAVLMAGCSGGSGDVATGEAPDPRSQPSAPPPSAAGAGGAAPGAGAGASGPQ